ncbi:hypothetical protein SG34_027795 [Thalassomonas viridans]|uniref:Uncharacterized protein n=1 Tax=Thalassomonas viridans TaxID=137584 RepID=A0AAE9Z2X3_9GAMM|nr:hypothetical protein [Thalassomonas viridans]WDE05059.1 hypothetical protein SG34_027795 [Thalassomonas viridans]
MAKPNDMPEFHSVKVSLTENIPAPKLKLISELIPRKKHPPAANAANTINSNFACGGAQLFSFTYSTNTGGQHHV